MKRFEIKMNKLAVGFLFSIFSWFLVNYFIVSISLLMFILLEIILAVSEKLCKFTLDLILPEHDARIEEDEYMEE